VKQYISVEIKKQEGARQDFFHESSLENCRLKAVIPVSIASGVSLGSADNELGMLIKYLREIRAETETSSVRAAIDAL